MARRNRLKGKTMKYSLILKFLNNLLYRGIDGEDLDTDMPDAELPDDDIDNPDDASEDDNLPDDDLEASEPKKIGRREQEMIRLRERAQEAEDRERRVREELDAARQSTQARPDPDKEIWEQEEAILKNPNADQWQKYSVQSARDARAAKREAANARLDAMDMVDKTKFDLYATTNPKVYEKYKDRVEQALQRVRAQGQNLPREVILQLELGKDLLTGKTKSAEKPKRERQAPPAVPRSDSSGRGKMSEREARAKRLENVNLSGIR